MAMLTAIIRTVPITRLDFGPNLIYKEEITMTTEQIITIAKEKHGKDIAEQEAQDYLDGKVKIPDDALDIVSGGYGRWNLPYGEGVGGQSG